MFKNWDLTEGIFIRIFTIKSNSWAVVVVKWSVCSPSLLTIRVRILLTPTVFSVKFVVEKNENKQKRGRGWLIFKNKKTNSSSANLTRNKLIMFFKSCTYVNQEAVRYLPKSKMFYCAYLSHGIVRNYSSLFLQPLVMGKRH